MGSAKRERQKVSRQVRLEQARAAQARKKRNRRILYAGLLVVAIIAALFVFAPDDDSDVTAGPSSTSTTVDPLGGSSTTAPGEPEEFTFGTGECPAADGSSERTIDFDDAPQLCIDPAKSYTAVFDTSLGEIRVALDTTSTPGATNNFVALARYHYYDGTEVFRTDPSIGIVQGGSPHTQDNGDPGPGYTIPDEGFDDDAALSGSGGPYTYLPGDLVYARPGGSPDSSSAQYFFCVTEECGLLDSQGIYIKFGSVVSGLEVLEAMLALDAGGAPSETITVNSVRIEEA